MFSELSTTDIKKIQKYIGLNPTGNFDNITIAGLKSYQSRLALPSVEQAIERILQESDIVIDDSDINISTDLHETLSPMIETNFLNPDQYFKGPTKKEYLFLHHTAGWDDPHKVVSDWNTDTRGNIGVAYVIGGVNPKTRRNEFDGHIVKCFEESAYAYHLGDVNSTMHKNSIGIELCSLGYAIEKNSKFYSYTGAEIDRKYITTLKKPFRGYIHWISYSEKQINSLYFLIKSICQRNDIDMKSGLVNFINTNVDTAFDYRDDARNGKIKGILAHVNVRKDKFDVFPQPELIDMLKSL